MSDIPNYSAVPAYIDRFGVVPDGFDGILGNHCILLRKHVYDELRACADLQEVYKGLKIFVPKP